LVLSEEERQAQEASPGKEYKLVISIGSHKRGGGAKGSGGNEAGSPRRKSKKESG